MNSINMMLKLLILYQKCGIFGYIRLYLLLFYCFISLKSVHLQRLNI